MPSDIGTLVSSFNINTANVVGAPVPYPVFNEFDEFGLILGLDRLPAEKSSIYKQRLLDVFAHRANSTYLGMINGITRELGLQQFKPFRIRPRTSSGLFIGENPVVIFNGPYVELWRDKTNNILEMKIDRFNQSGPAYSILELYNYINTNSIYFICDMLDTVNQDQKSMTILNQSNQILIQSEIINPTNRFTLEYPGLDGGCIVLDSLFFNDTTVFINRVSSYGAVVSTGQYYVNEYTGDIYSYTTPSINTIARYRYINYNSSFMKASPVILHAINSPNFVKQMFEQILGDDGNYYNGIPTFFGADLICELLSVYPLYFGK